MDRWRRSPQRSKAKGETLVFAMNAGMFGEDQFPVGLYVEDRRKLHEADTRGGATNFHMKPNGVFWIGDGVAGVTETNRYLAQTPPARYATQSGPMLVVEGRIHPKIRPDGTSQKIRNGVGACKGGAIMFAIAEEPVTFDVVRAALPRRPRLPERALPRRLGVVALCAGTQSRRRARADRTDCRSGAAERPERVSMRRSHPMAIRDAKPEDAIAACEAVARGRF